MLSCTCLVATCLPSVIVLPGNIGSNHPTILKFLVDLKVNAYKQATEEQQIDLKMRCQSLKLRLGSVLENWNDSLDGQELVNYLHDIAKRLRFMI